jgi:tRNA nucleotidyltransferase/poly(A) polymerase
MRLNMIKIPAELKELSKIFVQHGKKLYIVGGFVRDSYLGISSMVRNDIDLCSSVNPKELEKMLNGTKFEVSPINIKVGVMAILGKRRYEHATFRKEVYESEAHVPDYVEFISSLEEDARRRDFKINALYYDIEEGQFVDPLGAIEDLRDRVVTTVKVPKLVFNDDPERILRLIRFACALGMEIPEEEMYYAKQNAYKIQFISKFRLRNEFERLLTADQVYPELIYTRTAHFRAMVLLGEIDAWKYILPAMDDMMKTSIVDKKGEKIYDHILNSLKNSSPKIRLAVLLHDAAKVKTMESARNFFGSKDFVETIVAKNLGSYGLGYPKQTIKAVTRTIIGYDFNNWCLASKNTIKKFILNNKDIIENIIEIKSVVKNEGSSSSRKIRSAEILRNTYNEMLKENAPFDKKDLLIKGDDIIKLVPRIRLENIDTLLDTLLEKVALSPKKNNKDDLEILVHKVINSNRDFYLDE